MCVQFSRIRHFHAWTRIMDVWVAEVASYHCLLCSPLLGIVQEVVTLPPRDVEEAEQGPALGRRRQQHRNLVLVGDLDL